MRAACQVPSYYEANAASMNAQTEEAQLREHSDYFNFVGFFTDQKCHIKSRIKNISANPIGDQVEHLVGGGLLVAALK